MEKISFTKMSGAGNDFIILQDINDPPPVLIQNMCDRRNGIGADGVITISQYPNTGFKMQYYNSDGYKGSLCGNGARCAVKFAHASGMFSSSKVEFISGDILYSGEVLRDGKIKFNLQPPEKIQESLFISLNGKDIEIAFADTGSPHVVIYTDKISEHFGTKYNIEEVPVEGIGREIRYHEAFAPGGTNVNFLHSENGKLFIRTYERGVENETLACGTGSVAAAIISHLKKLSEPPVTLLTRSGEELVVNFNYRNSSYSDVSLTGPAEIIFTGEYRTKKRFNAGD
jgi:diaminopimelate epimerase